MQYTRTCTSNAVTLGTYSCTTMRVDSTQRLLCPSVWSGMSSCMVLTGVWSMFKPTARHRRGEEWGLAAANQKYRAATCTSRSTCTFDFRKIKNGCTAVGMPILKKDGKTRVHHSPCAILVCSILRHNHRRTCHDCVRQGLRDEHVEVLVARGDAALEHFSALKHHDTALQQAS